MMTDSNVIFNQILTDMNFSDPEIIYRVKHGDEAAFGTLRIHFAPSAFKFCQVLLKDDNEAENIICTVFDDIWNTHQTLNTDQDFQFFLFCNLRNRVFERLVQCKSESLKAAYLQRMQGYRDPA
jgi:hypothetical protein